MRFLHTSDWHLGKTLFNASLLDDQAHALDQVTAMVKDSRAEVLVVAGDLFDWAVPPKEAVALLDQTLDRIVRGLGVPVILIAGNHDSHPRLGFASRFPETHGLHVAGLPDSKPNPVIIGSTAFHLLPYADPVVIRNVLQNEKIRTHQDALKAQIALARSRHPKGHRFVAVGHVLVAGAETCDSELSLSIGATGEVDAALFKNCDYAALGHLHLPQEVGFNHVRYAGSLLKYSVSEANHAKGLTLVEIPSKGPVRIEALPLTPRRDLRRLCGYFQELLEGPHGNSADYLFLDLLDHGPVPDALARCRQVYPNILSIQPQTNAPSCPGELLETSQGELDPETLFRGFFREMQGRPMDEEESTIFREITARTFRSEVRK
ncbi:MAG: exonuclease SbcCD subunit D [Holophaga sp.]|nr:exonuclease SbcCD subunit D [Holophaga sp.]